MKLIEPKQNITIIDWLEIMYDVIGLANAWVSAAHVLVRWLQAIDGAQLPAGSALMICPIGCAVTGQVGGIRPATADHSHTGLAGRQGLLDLLLPLPRADAGHIPEHHLAAKTDPQPIPYTATGAPGIVTPVADEDTSAPGSEAGSHC